MSNSIQLGADKYAVSPTLFGLFLEDINFACDGGLSSNMINNHSFEGNYFSKKHNNFREIILHRPPKLEDDLLRYWKITGGSVSPQKENPLSDKNPWYASVQIKDQCELKNIGYNGGKKHANECAMGIKKDHTYEFRTYIRNHDFAGTIQVYVENQSGRQITDIGTIDFTKEWQETTCLLHGNERELGQLVIAFKGTGQIDLDCIYFGDTDVWGADDSKWSGGHFRRDIVELFQEMKPGFLRFPGGCIVEGLFPGNQYQWKDTIGPIKDRVAHHNLWATQVPDKGYVQSNQIGFYEYFLLCEDLNMEPLPIVWGGICCQMRSNYKVPTDSEMFQREVVQNALDLIEYANGDPTTNEWARKRAEAGHPEPFHLKMIGIGNENFGKDYREKFQIAKTAIQQKYPEITCVMSSGGFPSGRIHDTAWKFATDNFNDISMDEHFYKPPKWFYDNVNRYDSIQRKGSRIFIGEYAAANVGSKLPYPNAYDSALAEAAYLTGVEKNCDLISMTCYAPLLNYVDGGQWFHNMIEFNPFTVMKTANYLVQQLYSANLGTVLVDTKENLEKGIFTSATRDDNNLYIKLINSNDCPKEMCIEFGDYQVSGITKKLLQSDDLSAHNTLSFTGDAIVNIDAKTSVVPYKGEKALTLSLPKQSVLVLCVDYQKQN